jgi:predicted DNA-binding transcriptional regulator AlpA
MEATKKTISTTKVLQMTLMSRYTLHRKVKVGEFPAPVGKDGNKDLYVEAEVKKWCEENLAFVQRRLQQRAATIDLNSKQLKVVRKASQLLDCEIEPFIIDAAVWKARYILDRTTH